MKVRRWTSVGPAWQKPVLLGALALAAAGPLIACWGPEYESVHFNDAKPDFFRMPRPWRGIPSEKRAHPAEAYDESAWQRPSQADEVAKQARAAEAAGRFAQAGRLWREQQRLFDREMDPSHVGQAPTAVPGLDDRIAALEAWRGAGDNSSLRAYLQARDLVDAGKNPVEVLKGVTAASLTDRAAYLKAAYLFEAGRLDAALAAYREVTRRYPRDPLARYMVGRCCFRQVYARETKADPEEEARKPAPLLADQRKAFLEQGRGAYEAAALIGAGTPLGSDAEGMAAACDYRLERYPEALVRYCRILARQRGREESRSTWISARDTLEKMSAGDHDRFQKLAAPDVEAGTVYLDLHLRYGRAGAGAQYRLGLFALDLLKRYPAAALSGRMLTRLADIEERFGHHARAEKLSAAALKRLPPGLFRDEARWQHAVSLRSLGRSPEALAEFEALSSGAVLANMRAGADEAAALLSEAARDYANAIRHYFALDYGLDYGYLVDIRATQDDLREFLKRFPNHPRAKLVRYSLGFRQLRAGQFEEAVRTFEALGAYLDAAEQAYQSTTAKGEPRWPPLRTARFLADAERRERGAKTPEEKAKVAYERGRALFWGRYELLYNGALWQGRRLFALEPDNVPDAARLLDRHEKEHTALYQALLVFDRIARDYPDTPEAPRALYSAALCCTFMSNMDPFWSRQGKTLTGRAIGYYRRLQREYPSDPLAAAAARFGGRV